MLSPKNLIVTISAILLINTANAQTATRDSDYVITMKGDTIKCRVNTPFIGAVNYTVDNDKTSVKIKPTEIREYFIARKKDTERSVTKKGKSKRLFLKTIEKGTICLYEEIVYYYSTYGSSTTITWHVSKGSDIVEELKFSSLIAFNKQARKEAFAEMIKDNKDVYDRYQAGDQKFTFKQIRMLVHLYNTGQWKENFD